MIVIAVIVSICLVIATICRSWDGSPKSTVAVPKRGNAKEESEVKRDHLDDMKVQLLDRDNIKELKQGYDSVIKAVDSIPPKFRTNQRSYPLWRFDVSNIADLSSNAIKCVQTHIIDKIKKDLKVDKLPTTLLQKMKDVFETITMDIIVEHKDEYCEIDLSGEFGGTSNIRIGVIGMKRIPEKKEVILGAALYFEQWTECRSVRINTSNNVWNKENVTKFAKYLLIEDIDKKIKAENIKQKELIAKEGGTVLYNWLESIGSQYCQYYTNFRDNGYDRISTISKIKENDLENDFKISKPGHRLAIWDKIKEAQQQLNQINRNNDNDIHGNLFDSC